MKYKYEKPNMTVVLLQGRHHLLQASQQGMSMNMSGYQQGGDGSGDNDGWK